MTQVIASSDGWHTVICICMLICSYYMNRTNYSNDSIHKQKYPSAINIVLRIIIIIIITPYVYRKAYIHYSIRNATYQLLCSSEI